MPPKNKNDNSKKAKRNEKKALLAKNPGDKREKESESSSGSGNNSEEETANKPKNVAKSSFHPFKRTRQFDENKDMEEDFTDVNYEIPKVSFSNSFGQN